MTERTATGTAEAGAASGVTEAVVARIGADGSRLGTVLSRLTRDLHRAMGDLGITEAELQGALGFLGAVGRTATDRRQEWGLLSDVLGLSSRVVEIEERSSRGGTPRTLRGPFYRGDAPIRRSRESIALDGAGAPLAVTGRVTDPRGTPIPGAMIETWQANPDGLYENQDPDGQPEFNLRGVFQADAAGRFEYRTVRPGPCRLPGDGPVRRLLDTLAMSTVRPAHLNFRVTAPRHRTLVTHVFDGADPAIDDDAVFTVRPELLGHIATGADGLARLDFEFRLVPLDDDIHTHERRTTWP